MKVYVDLLDSDLRTLFHALTIGSNNCNSTCMHKDCKNCWFKKGVDSLRKKFTNPQSLADYTKQVRKEVCEEIKDIVKKLEKPTNNTDEKILSGEMIKVTQEQLIFLKKFIIKYDKITVEEYLEHNLWWEDFEKEDIVYWYKECPELMYIISPFLYYRLQKYYNEEALCAGWCGCVDLKQIYDYIKMSQKYNKEYFLE